MAIINKKTPVKVKVPTIASKKFGIESNVSLKKSGDSLSKILGLMYFKIEQRIVDHEYFQTFLA